MKTPLARVEWICEDEVRASIDVPLCSGELAVSDDGEWVGLVTSVRQGAVVLRSLDPPERLVVGQLLRFLGSDHLPDMDSLRWGSVIDPLGRVLHDGPRGRNPILGTHTRSFWGLGRLETAFEVPRGSSLVIAGDGSVGIAKLMAEALRRQTADWAAVVCQGGLRELNRLIDGAVDAGTVEKTIFIWSPLWSRPALSQLIPQCLKKVCQAAPQGHGLILFDDLRRWIETGREWSEESGQDLLASGFSPLCRIGVARLLDMPARGIETSVSLLAGWPVDRTAPRLTEHPYGRLVELLTDQGIVLENRQERLRPTYDGWGRAALALQSRKALEEAADGYDDAGRAAALRLAELLDGLYLSLGPGEIDDVPATPWRPCDHDKILYLCETPDALPGDFPARAQRLGFESLDGPEASRLAIRNWLNSCGRKGDLP